MPNYRELRYLLTFDEEESGGSDQDENEEQDSLFIPIVATCGFRNGHFCIEVGDDVIESKDFYRAKEFAEKRAETLGYALVEIDMVPLARREKKRQMSDIDFGGA